MARILTRSDLIALGKDAATSKLQALGCQVVPPADRRDGKLTVQTPAGRSLEVFVSTQRLGGYAFWTKRRLQPAAHRLAVVVLLDTKLDPDLYLVPSIEWKAASPPLTDRDYEGMASEPEYGISLSASSLPLLRRYAWTNDAARRLFA